MRWSRDNGVITVAMRLFDNLRWVGSPLFCAGKAVISEQIGVYLRLSEHMYRT